jgi:ATP-binding cassette subfamily B multidrug efflux pump
MESRRFGPSREIVPAVKPHNFSGTLKRILTYFKSERKMFSLISFLIVSDSLMLLSIPYLIGRGIDAISLNQRSVSFNLLGIMVFVILSAYITDGISSFLQGWLMAGVSQRIVKSLRTSLFSKLQKLPIVFFDIHTHGDIMSRLANDIENVSITISQSTVQLFSGIIAVFGSFVIMLLLSPPLAAASVISVPLAFLLTNIISKKSQVYFTGQQEELGKLNGHLEETITGVNVVKAFNHEDEVIKQFDVINRRLCQIGLKAQIWTGALMPLMNVVNNLVFAIIAFLGGTLALKGQITIGIIASFIVYARQFSGPLVNFSNIFNTLQTAVAGAERVFEILDEKEEDKDVEGAKELIDPRGDVTFENVSFGYRQDVQIIKNISFEVKKGGRIALVGPTGAGKTTIVNLLSRFYDVSSGRILIDGVDIKEYTRDSLRKCFGIVLQDTYLFSGTIKDNIRYGNLEASDEEVIKAAEMANAHVFISRLPQGYDTVLSESGSNLSQGQRQILAIARAILTDPAILILDEATSSVDTRTELHIQEAMLELMKGRTCFIIAHRLSTIRDADTIMVIDNGEIVEKGNHESLINSNGVYHNLYFDQLNKLHNL